jgi:alpha-galactosidase/6-phospho-beta-glucosidase family protein
MNIVFLGGGSLRLTPIIRGLLKRKDIFEGGSIRLVDLNLGRAEMVGRAVMRCPEMQGITCEVVWTDDLDSVLVGADMLYLTMAIERQPSLYLSHEASIEHGFFASDQLSLTGAFLAARAGKMILSFARKMEKYCPNAMMLIFANPVAVYSAMVNNHTKIKALGICGGFTNHRWDIPRLCGSDVYDDSMELVATGVNHLSFITGGRWQGRDFFEVMKDHLGEGWHPPEITSNPPLTESIHKGLRQLRELFNSYGTTVFSTEQDGLAHLFTEEYLRSQKEGFTTFSEEELDQKIVELTQKRDGRFDEFAAILASGDDTIWDAPLETNSLFGLDDTDLSISIIESLAGLKSFRIAASAPNNGAVKGFDDRAALEYTMTIKGDTITPVENQYVPAPFYGLIAGMSEFQTLLADAIAADDPRLFAQALEAYPVQQFTTKRSDYLYRLFEIFSDIPASLQKAKDFIRG